MKEGLTQNKTRIPEKERNVPAAKWRKVAKKLVVEILVRMGDKQSG